MFAALAVVAGAGVLLVRGEPGAASASASSRATVARVDQTSLAVLPFTNLSSDPENAFFAGGIHDELLTQLTRISGLRVISRTTMLQYEDTDKTVRQVGAELDAGAVMEGSVQRVGNRVRVNVQLIDAATDGHLWAESYDREITDLFAVQSEVAHAVATALRATLSPKQDAQLARRPTESAEAYGFYLRGVDAEGRARLEENFREAVRTLERAVALDPDFAEAWAALSHAQGSLYWFGHDPTQARLQEARSSAERAYELAPQLPVVRMAMAVAHYRALDYRRALEFAEAVLAETPDLAADHTAAIYRRQGRWEESTRLYERAVELDPASPLKLYDLALNYARLGRFADAEAALERAIALDPEAAPSFYTELGATHVRWRGDLKAARASVARMPDRFASDRALALAGYDAAESRYQEGLDRPAGAASGALGAGCRRGACFLMEGFLLDRLGRVEEARSRYRMAADTLEAIVGGEGFNVRSQDPYGSQLALAYAGLGLRARAIATVERYVADLPASLDAVDGPVRLLEAAQVFAAVGEKGRAVAMLEQALSTPVDATPSSLRLDPLLASLRGFPPFEALLREHESR